MVRRTSSEACAFKVAKVAVVLLALLFRLPHQVDAMDGATQEAEDGSTQYQYARTCTYVGSHIWEHLGQDCSNLLCACVLCPGLRAQSAARPFFVGSLMTTERYPCSGIGFTLQKIEDGRDHLSGKSDAQHIAQETWGFGTGEGAGLGAVVGSGLGAGVGTGEGTGLGAAVGTGEGSGVVGTGVDRGVVGASVIVGTTVGAHVYVADRVSQQGVPKSLPVLTCQ